jgi:hypothetical protein
MNTTELIDALIECGITFNATQRDRLKAKFAELLGKSNAEPSAEESEQFLKEYGSYANSLGVNTIAAYRLKVWLEARASLPAEQSKLMPCACAGYPTKCKQGCSLPAEQDAELLEQSIEALEWALKTMDPNDYESDPEMYPALVKFQKSQRVLRSLKSAIAKRKDGE